MVPEDLAIFGDSNHDSVESPVPPRLRLLYTEMEAKKTAELSIRGLFWIFM